jgi:hypothetical protein
VGKGKSINTLAPEEKAMDYKKKISSEELLLAVCVECGEIIEPYANWFDGFTRVLEYRHFCPLAFLILSKKEGKRSYEIEIEPNDDDLRKLLAACGEIWTQYATIEEVRGVLRRGLYEIFNSRRP